MAFPFQFDPQMKIFIGNVKIYVPEFYFFNFYGKNGGGSEAKNQISPTLTLVLIFFAEKQNLQDTFRNLKQKLVS